jgi:hypothetical protein
MVVKRDHHGREPDVLLRFDTCVKKHINRNLGWRISHHTGPKRLWENNVSEMPLQVIKAKGWLHLL